MSNKSTITVSTQPPQGIFSFFKKLSYTFQNAIAELVDNSVASFRENRGIKDKSITLLFDAKGKRIIVRDTAGGIAPDKWNNVIRLMESDIEKARKQSLNEFGMGLKTSGFWLGDRITIISKHESEETGRKVVMDISQHELDEEINVIESDLYAKSPFLLKETGTVIIISGVEKQMSASFLKNDVVSFFSSKYRNDISKGLKIRMILNEKIKDNLFLDLAKWHKNDNKTESYSDTLNWTIGTPLSYKYPEIFRNERREFSFEVNHNNNTYQIEGWVANKQEGTRNENMGFALMRRGTVIIDQYAPKELFGAGNSFETLRIFGEINFSSNMPVTQAKDKFDWSDGLEEKFKNAIFKNDAFVEIRELSRKPRSGKPTKLTKNDIAAQSKEIIETFKMNNNVNSILSVVPSKSQTTDDNTLVFVVETQESGKITVVSNLIFNSQEWIKVSESKDGDLVVAVCVNHPFFTPFNSGDKNFIGLVRKISIAYAISSKESDETGEDVKYFNKRFNNYLKIIAEGGMKNV